MDEMGRSADVAVRAGDLASVRGKSTDRPRTHRTARTPEEETPLMSTTKSKVINGVAGAALLFVGVGIGAAGNSPAAPAAAEPAPTVTKTISVPGPTVTEPAEAAGPVTTKTVKVPGPVTTKTIKVPGPVTTKTVTVKVKAAAPQAPAVEDKPAAVDTSGETASQRNARDKAGEYLEYTSFSRSGLIDQLKFEGFNTSDATYGVDAAHVDWNKQAALKAKEYLEYTSFSRSGLVDQLEFDGFTTAQATYGVAQTRL
jgi:hypothetical protein